MIVAPLTPALVQGTPYLEPDGEGVRLHRLPPAVRARDADPQMLMVEEQPSGVRLVFTTMARRAVLTVRSSRVAFRGVARPRGRVETIVDGMPHLTHVLEKGDLTELDAATGARTLHEGGPERIEIPLPAGDKTVEVWLPHSERIDLLALESDAPVAPAPDARPVWLHHGSSISHGSNATSPTGIWPVVAARRAGVSLRSLGFGGSAMVDPFVARVIRDAPADLISVKLGINVVNADAMRLRSFVPAVHGFLDTIRDGHPDTPLLLVSPIFCGIHESTPGPGSIDPEAFASGTMRFVATGSPAEVAQGRLTLRVIRDALAEVAAARSDDAHLAYLDGLRLYGESDAHKMPLPDGLHPDAAAHASIGERFADIALAPGGLLSARGRGSTA